MIITTDYATLENSMATVSAIVSDKMLQDDLKNVIVWVKEGKVRFAAYSGHIVSATEVDATAIQSNSGVEEFAQLRAKEINDVLSSFKGLSRTKVSKIEFHIQDDEAIMHVFEEPVDEELRNAEEYRQESKFRISKPRIKELVKNEIQKIDIEAQGESIPSVDLLLYINALYPTVQKETRESTRNVLFSSEHIYTVLAPYTAIMVNKLPKVLSGFLLQNTVVNFLKNFIQGDEMFSISKEELGNGAVILTVKVGNSVAVIKCADMSRAYDMTNFVSTPQNGVVVDRQYLIDVLKRMNLSSEAAHVEVEIVDGRGSMKIVSKNMTQNIPVIHTKGEGLFPFSIRAELLSSLVFSHVSYFDENIFFYFEHGDRNNIVMAVKDNTNAWQTKVTGLTPSKADFAWK